MEAFNKKLPTNGIELGRAYGVAKQRAALSLASTSSSTTTTIENNKKTLKTVSKPGSKGRTSARGGVIQLKSALEAGVKRRGVKRIGYAKDEGWVEKTCRDISLRADGMSRVAPSRKVGGPRVVLITNLTDSV